MILLRVDCEVFTHFDQVDPHRTSRSGCSFLLNPDSSDPFVLFGFLPLWTLKSHLEFEFVEILVLL